MVEEVEVVKLIEVQVMEARSRKHTFQSFLVLKYRTIKTTIVYFSSTCSQSVIDFENVVNKKYKYRSNHLS